jgi:protein-disulfide isomerase/uncharacterized membrane protein
MPPRRLLVLLGVCLSGVALSAYSLVQTYALRDGDFGISGLCSLGALFDCRAAHGSEHAFLFGIPIAWFALGYYAWAVTLIAAAWVKKSARPACRRALFTASLAALGFSVWKAAVLFFSIRVLCPVCLLLYAISLAVPLLCLDAPGMTLVRLGRRGRAALASGLSLLRPVGVWAWLVVLGLGLGTTGWVLSAREGASLSQREIRLLKETVRYERQPFQALSVPTGTPSRGRRDAPIHIVEFADFECPFCRLATKHLRDLLRENEERIRVDFIHYPIDSDVNPMARLTRHRHATAAARASVLAAELGLFWEFHDALFEYDGTPDRGFLASWFEDAGVPAERLEAALADPKTDRLVREHIALGNRLDIRETPAYFVNGRRVTPFFPAVLDHIVRRELSRLGGSRPGAAAAAATGGAQAHFPFHAGNPR